MMDSLRKQFYPSMRQAGRERKISDSHRKRYSCPMCENGLSQMMLSQIKIFISSVRCLAVTIETTTKNDRKEREIISVWDSNPGLSSAKVIMPLLCLIP